MKRVVLLAATLILVPASPAAAQDARRLADGLAVGYSANAPNQYFGFSAFTVRKGAVGFYADMKLTLPNLEARDDFYSNISIRTAEQYFGDRHIDSRSSWTSFNGGITYRLASAVALYVGMGLTAESRYRKYDDPTGILGREGQYWIEDKAGGGLRPNVFGGVFLPIDPAWMVQLGAEMGPQGFTVGFARTLFAYWVAGGEAIRIL